MASSEIKVRITDMAEFKNLIAITEERLQAAESLAAGVRSFLESMAFQPPEAMGFQARVKLAEPLAEWEAACSPTEGSSNE